MANGLTDPKPPKGYQPEVYELDPATMTLKPVTKYIPPLSPGWMRRNVTLGNVLVIVSMLAAMLMSAQRWTSDTRATEAEIKNRVVVAETTIEDLKSSAVRRDVIEARLDTIISKLSGLDTRLTRIEERVK